MGNKNMEITKEIFSWIKEIIIVIVVVFFILTFIAQNTRVIGSSMQPTLQEGNAIIINKFIYRFVDPARGDIIVFPYAGNHDRNYIKRIIGLPGDQINLVNQQIYINGKAYKEPYIKEPIRETGNITYPFTVPKGQYFVMGDNRNNSRDSRFTDVGTISKDEIIGKASVRLWPLNEFGFVH